MPSLLHDIDVPTKKATFSMGCFWAPDSLFGVQKGVIRTRVGFAGGTTENPSYHSM
jgi:peptide-methionine (S)-S-oxide reductase